MHLPLPQPFDHFGPWLMGVYIFMVLFLFQVPFLFRLYFWRDYNNRKNNRRKKK